MLWLSLFEKWVWGMPIRIQQLMTLQGRDPQSFSELLEIVVTLCAPPAYI